MKKTQVGLELSDTGLRLRKRLAEKLGISMSGVIELALRLLGKQEGVDGDA